jgi:hypothetical protein
MPLCGTFRYAGVVPADGPQSYRWTLQDESGASAKAQGDPMFDNRLVGLHPLLQVSTDQLILRAFSPHRAEVSSAALKLDPDLIQSFRQGDVLNLVRTGTADIGISLVRRKQLIFAVGAATEVPVGEAVSVRAGSCLDSPKLDLEHWPRKDTWVDVAVSGETGRLRAGDKTVLGDYAISVLRCFEDGVPGTHECLAISLNEACDYAAAVRSAELLAVPNAGLVMNKFGIGDERTRRNAKAQDAGVPQAQDWEGELVRQAVDYWFTEGNRGAVLVELARMRAELSAAMVITRVEAEQLARLVVRAQLDAIEQSGGEPKFFTERRYMQSDYGLSRDHDRLDALELVMKDRQLVAKDLSSLIKMLDTSPTRMDALSALERKGGEAAKAIPRLLELLRETDQLECCKVLRTLAGIGPAAQDALSAVMQLAKEPDYLIRLQARATVKAIAPERTSEFGLGK